MKYNLQILKICLLILSIIVICSMGITTASAANNTTIYVNTHGNDNWDGLSPIYNTTGSGPKLSIINATSTVTDNGTIYIANGTYNQTGDYNININKNMTLIGASQTGTIINAHGNAGIFNIASEVTLNLINTTLENGLNMEGGAVYNSGTFTVTNCTFKNNTAYAAYDGGAICNKGTLTVDNSSFTSNSGGIGGAIANNGILTVNNSSFKQNAANGLLGGAIANTDNSTVNNCTFTDNTAYSNSGGAIGNWDSSLAIVNIINSTFTGNSADIGGAIVNYEGSLILNKSSFTNNIATSNYDYSGGAICNRGTLTDNNSTYTNNSAYYGGAVDNVNGGTSTLTNITLTSNTGTEGGAIYNDGTVNILNSTLTQNNATNGGAIYIYGGTLTLNNSTLTENNATNGGAIYNNGISTVNGGDFMDNTAAYGGAIYNNANLNLTNSDLNNNTATDGGAIYNNANLNLTNSDLNNNTASEGGAIYNNSNGATVIINLTNSTLTGNTATDSGGAIYNYAAYSGEADINIILSIFQNNKASNNGGAFYNTISSGTSKVTITNTTFIQNTANLYGGVIWNEGRQFTVNNGTFMNNTATNGGAIYNYGLINITDGTLTQNNAFQYGGAIYNEINGNLNITSSTLTQNTAINGGAIYNYGYMDSGYASKAIVNITNSTLTNNNALLYGGALYNDGGNVNSYSQAIITVTSSTLTNNSANDGGVLYNFNDQGIATAGLNFNRIVYNTATGQGFVIYNSGNTVGATLNWWGNNNPALDILITGTGTVNCKPYLVLNITANPTSIYYGGNSTVNGYILNDSNGNYHDPTTGCVPGVPITFTSTLGNMNPTNNVLFNGTAESTFTSNNIGTATITATIDSQTVSTSIQINTSPTNLTLTSVHNFAGQNVILTANVTDYYGNPVNGGEVAFSVNHTSAGTVSVVDGVATATWQIPSNWSVGIYPVIVASYSGGGTNYLNSINSSTLTVDPTPTNVSVTSVHNFAGQTVTLTANVKDYYNNPVNSGQVTFTVNGVNAGTVNVNSGVATLNNWTIPSNWNAGVYTITANYLANSNYTANNNTGNLTVDPTPTHISVPHVDNFAGQNVTVTAQVTDYYGSNVNVGQVTFTIGNATPINVPVINGAATATWQIPSNWAVGHYTITANYNGTNNYQSSQAAGDLRVDPTPTNTTVNNTHNFRGQNVTLISHINDYYGNPVNQGRVQFKVNGNNVGGQVNVNNGTATYTYLITGLNPGNYTILATYLANSNYTASINIYSCWRCMSNILHNHSIIFSI